ncbi:pyrroloquinoline quinone biosynthesis protein PqqF [Stutzerimonas stutzeri]|uniref:Coenzyme PQQ synthesis protein F n=1 Tax=Stutzerimonas stutzeri TaxID=316 RepID=W8RAY5_STUST|nr:pyrroloquinoline quinone biosynthesis protein PqqF [Stutzerimonas stutzeri]AHL75592.1 pyrroloquinoline quinone biosynthesis protein PqqF [Stutzerimonas stutzeri]MCQ4327832.1 pyrroloquinoline quinone biosynthesis protein PqqF [Stutzerimonas stutzeri]
MLQSSDPTQRPPQVTLNKGLRVRLLALSQGTQAAALVRIHAGSHDAPAAYPGLAHFLEHLLFLGSRDYDAAQSLMPFVQGCGGQLNASTRERHTDFFFQLPASQLEAALWRLLDMLAHPLLDPTAQVGEREVLHAEYRARAQDIETLCDAALSTAFEPAHPFSGFHAGNRDTLPVEDAQFQQALRDFHQRFYQSGQIELLLAGPQSAAELQRLAALADDALAAGDTVTRAVPSLRCNRDVWLRLQLGSAQPRLNLLFAFADMPEHGVTSLDHLASWITSEAPDGLVQRLRTAGLCQSLKLRVPYWHAGQGAVVVELLLTDRGLAERARIVGAVLDWLRFFSGEARWQPCREEYRCIRQRSLQSAEPLARLRHWVDPLAWGNDSDEAAIREALGTLLTQMIDDGPLVLTADTAACEPIEIGGFPLRLALESPHPTVLHSWGWQQPVPNPWLQPCAPLRAMSPVIPALRCLGLEDASSRGALFLHWRFAAGQPWSGLWHTLSHALSSSTWAARQAGVTLRFEELGDGWCLSLVGFAEAIPTILGDISQLLLEPPAESFPLGDQLAEREAALGDGEMLIRQLLRRLPRLLASATHNKDYVAAPAEPSALHRHWQLAQWHGLAIGFAPALSGSLAGAITTLPGTPTTSPGAVVGKSTGKRWHAIGGGAPMAETAFLLFCPLPERTAACEAAWRVLARLLEGDFFRCLRSELQLGYAVFSRFCQLGGHAGMLFAVQSPSASAEAILDHIETFLLNFAMKLANEPAEIVEHAARAASDRHVAGPGELHARAEQAWQSLLAGHDVAHPMQVAAAMSSLQRDDLTAALDTLRAATGGWVAFANASAPDLHWS